MRRDLLVLLSYRVAFASDLLFIGIQAAMFGFVAQLVDPLKLPTYGGERAGYFEFVMVGVVITTVSGLLLQRVATAIRQEQMIGTLEALLVTPTSATTVQAGSVAFDLLFIPIRMGLLLLAAALTLGLGFEASGILPSVVLLAAFVPFLWGLGLVTAAAIVTFRRGTGVLGVTMSVLGLVSGGVLPAHAAARLDAGGRRGQSGRRRDGGHARGADRRLRLGRRRDRDARADPVLHVGADGRRERLPRRARSRAPARDVGLD